MTTTCTTLKFVVHPSVCLFVLTSEYTNDITHASTSNKLFFFSMHSFPFLSFPQYAPRGSSTRVFRPGTPHWTSSRRPDHTRRDLPHDTDARRRRIHSFIFQCHFSNAQFDAHHQQRRLRRRRWMRSSRAHTDRWSPRPRRRRRSRRSRWACPGASIAPSRRGRSRRAARASSACSCATGIHPRKREDRRTSGARIKRIGNQRKRARRRLGSNSPRLILRGSIGTMCFSRTCRRLIKARRQIRIWSVTEASSLDRCWNTRRSGWGWIISPLDTTRGLRERAVVVTVRCGC